jgi:hypothetical protein
MKKKTFEQRVRDNDFDYFEVPEGGFNVFSWCPAPTPTVPPTQVHLHLPPIGGDARIVIRFKSPRTIDKLIEALVQHREDVWGERLTDLDVRPNEVQLTEWTRISGDYDAPDGAWLKLARRLQHAVTRLVAEVRTRTTERREVYEDLVKSGIADEFPAVRPVIERLK